LSDRARKIVRVKARGEVVRTLSEVVEEGLELSVLNATVTPDSITAELAVQAPEEGQVREFLRTLRRFGLEVEELEKTLIHDEETCVHCTACHSVCPVGAVLVENHEVSFDEDECIVCGSCVEICPTGALKIASKEGGE